MNKLLIGLLALLAVAGMVVLVTMRMGAQPDSLADEQSASLTEEQPAIDCEEINRLGGGTVEAVTQEGVSEESCHSEGTRAIYEAVSNGTKWKITFESHDPRDGVWQICTDARDGTWQCSGT